MSKLSAVPRRRKARALVRIIPIREFWKVYCGFSPATGYRREHDDPDHPPLVLTVRTVAAFVRMTRSAVMPCCRPARSTKATGRWTPAVRACSRRCRTRSAR